MERLTDLLIAGGGAAGLAAAVAAARGGLRVTVVERLAKPGVRLCASGGGHGNIGNTASLESLIAAFEASARFVKPALSRYCRDEGGPISWLGQLGVRCSAEDGFHLFPESGQAAHVRNALAGAAATAGVELVTGRRVEVIDKHVDGGFHVLAAPSVGTAETVGWKAAACLIACGGASRPALGGGRDGYALAERLGHSLTPVYPALCGLELVEDWPKTLTGISLPEVMVSVDASSEDNVSSGGGRRREKMFPPQTGAMSFTHGGLSGPAVLNCSGAVNVARGRGETVGLRVNFTPGRDDAFWRERLEEARRLDGTKGLWSVTRGHVPESLARALCAAAGCAEDRVAGVTRAGRERWLRHLTDCRLTVSGSGGWEQAMAARGGVARDGVVASTLESRLVEGLFFAGEVLDVDGPCGGYNLSWAFASGLLAAHSAARLLSGAIG